MELDSEDDRLVFIIKNLVQNISMDNLQRFFEKGYSTKEKGARKRGLGLYNAKLLVGRYHGEICVSIDKAEDKNYICMKVIV